VKILFDGRLDDEGAYESDIIVTHDRLVIKNRWGEVGERLTPGTVELLKLIAWRYEKQHTEIGTMKQERDAALEQARLIDSAMTKLNIQRTREARDAGTFKATLNIVYAANYWANNVGRRATAESRLMDAIRAYARGDVVDAALEMQRRIDEQSDKIGNLEADKKDLDVQARFWKQACEQALDESNKLEDKITAVHDVICTFEGNADVLRELLGDDPLAPADDAPPACCELVTEKK